MSQENGCYIDQETLEAALCPLNNRGTLVHGEKPGPAL